jgi:anti-sigma regulatory factor (Ser/Thr protein kinase)
MTSVLLPVHDPSQTSDTRRRARRLAQDLGFDEAAAERAAIAISEACTNLLKHGGGGEVFLSASEFQRTPLLEFLALDRGPGMIDVAICTQDGFSTSGTLGNGLGAIGRVSSFCDIYSQPGKGTAILARISADQRVGVEPARFHGLRAPKPGQDVCGDAWTVLETDEARVTVVVADGLGHGPDAALASQTAVAIAEENPGLSPKDTLDVMHRGIRHTRGAAIGVASVDRDRGLVSFATLGNISGRICEPGAKARHMVSMNGTAGAQLNTSIREFQYPFPANSAVILHSDGLSSRWDMKDYAGLLSKDPALIGGVLFRDHRRQTDDGSVVVAK